MKRIIYNLVSLIVVLLPLKFFAQTKTMIKRNTKFTPAVNWYDEEGNIINAHGGGILFYNDTYYWYGEIKKSKTTRVPDATWENYRVVAGGVSCYSSKDLLNWKYEGVALASEKKDTASDLYQGKVIERPKVIYNSKTKKFVMWLHIDSKDYSAAKSGVAVSDKPQGPFTYLRSERPNRNMARDMTVFVDDDGKAYHFFSSEENATMHVCLLTDDYLSHTKKEKRILINQKREAPAVFKYHNKYYLITSGCTGWSPNAASYAVADSIMGDWQQSDNPCTGSDADKTFYAQSTYIIPVNAETGKFIFMADRWKKTNLEDSRYIWLPLTMKNDKPQIIWFDSWHLTN
jgi:sucrose-6-phosphate hydrolase SacC (GH32 family)